MFSCTKVSVQALFSIIVKCKCADVWGFAALNPLPNPNWHRGEKKHAILKSWLFMSLFWISGYLEKIQLIRAKVPILRFREKGRWEMMLLPVITVPSLETTVNSRFLSLSLPSVAWSLIWMSTTRWESETRSSWEATHTVRWTLGPWEIIYSTLNQLLANIPILQHTKMAPSRETRKRLCFISKGQHSDTQSTTKLIELLTFTIITLAELFKKKKNYINLHVGVLPTMLAIGWSWTFPHPETSSLSVSLQRISGSSQSSWRWRSGRGTTRSTTPARGRWVATRWCWWCCTTSRVSTHSNGPHTHTQALGLMDPY